MNGSKQSVFNNSKWIVFVDKRKRGKEKKEHTQQRYWQSSEIHQVAPYKQRRRISNTIAPAVAFTSVTSSSENLLKKHPGGRAIPHNRRPIGRCPVSCPKF